MPVRIRMHKSIYDI